MADVCKIDPHHPSQNPEAGAPIEGKFPQEAQQKIEREWHSLPWKKAPLHGEEMHRRFRTLEKLRKAPLAPRTIEKLMRSLRKQAKEEKAKDFFDHLLKGVEIFFKDLWQDLSPLTHLFSEDKTTPNA
jgi:hypothetical protein